MVVMESTSVTVVKTDALTPIKAMVLNSVTSQHSKVAYHKALTDFLTWYQTDASGNGFTKATVQRWVVYLESTGLSASTINLRLSAVRKLALEAADNGLMAPAAAQGVARAKGPKQAGTRTGNWLTKNQAEALIGAADVSKLKGQRDRAVLALMIGCGLRRSEVSALAFEHIQQRDGRWAIVDLIGKGNRMRTVPMPGFAKVAIDQWASAASIDTGRVFRSLDNKGQLAASVLLPQNIMVLVGRYGAKIGVPTLAPHDLRRTFAKLAHKGSAALEQIQLSLGHASIQTTERYLGVRQDLSDAPCDHLGLRLAV